MTTVRPSMAVKVERAYRRIEDELEVRQRIISL